MRLGKLRLPVHIPAWMVVTPSVTKSRLQLARSVGQRESFANEAKVVGLIPGPRLQQPSVFTNACHWIRGEECAQREQKPESILGKSSSLTAGQKCPFGL